MFDSIRLIITRIRRKRRLKIPLVDENQLGLNVVSIETIEDEHVDGNVSVNELRIISKIIAKQQPHAIFEIGTFDGRTTINLARCAPENAKVYTLDLPKKDSMNTKFPLYSYGFSSDLKYINKERSGTRWRGKACSEKIVQLFGDSATFDYSPYLGQIGFVFIDGSHAKDYVRNDTEVAFKLLGEHGTMVWHDYGVWEDVSNVLDSYFENDERFKNAKHIKGTCFVALSF